MLPWVKSTEQVVVDHVVPLEVLSNGQKAGFSSVNALGFVFYSFPKLNGHFSFIDFAIDYTHEIGHQVLFRYQLTGDIFEDGFKQSIYSAIKKTERPAIMAFHAAFALTYMKVTLICLLKSKQLSKKEILYCNESLKSYTEMLSVTVRELLSKDIKYTNIGMILLNEILLVNRLKHSYEEVL